MKWEQWPVEYKGAGGCVLGAVETVAHQNTYDPDKGCRAHGTDQCLAGRIVVTLSDFSREHRNPDFFLM